MIEPGSLNASSQISPCIPETGNGTSSRPGSQSSPTQTKANPHENPLPADHSAAPRAPKKAPEAFKRRTLARKASGARRP